MNNVVISSRIRLARNLSDMPFPCVMSDEQKSQAVSAIHKAIDAVSTDETDKLMFVAMDDVSEFDSVAMVERHLISPEFADSSHGRALAVNKDESISIMINEEDHLRIQVILPSLKLKEAYDIADRLDTQLDGKLHFAFDEKLGFLTQCPTNLGTALRASVMLHLPALQASRTIPRIAANLSKLGLVIRGSYGEDTEVAGAMYQLSNQITLGISEKAAIENLSNITEQLVASELSARENLLQSDEYQDRISRSLGILLTARIISHSEAMKLLSNVRMGITQGLVEDITLDTVDSLMLSIQPASLMRAQGKKLDVAQRDRARAELIRETLNK